MKYSDKLRAKMQTALDKQKAIMKAVEDEDRDMTEAETAEFDGHTKAYDTAKTQLASVEAMEAREVETAKNTKAAKRDATGVIERATTGDPAPRNAPFRFGQRELTGIERAGVAVWGAAKAKHYPAKTPHEHLEEAGFQKIADECREAEAFLKENKSWLTTSGTTGANTITTPLSPEFIDWLENRSAFMAGGPVPVDLSYGTLQMSGGANRTTGSYTAEGASIPYTEATTRNINLSAKHLRAATAVGNHNIEVSPFAIASLVGDELGRSMVVAMDAAGLRGDGTGANPAGILTFTHASHKLTVADLTAPTFTQVETEAKRALVARGISNVPKIRLRWIMSGRTKYYLQFLRDGNGNLLYPGLQQTNPTWCEGIPVIDSEQVPSNLGVGTNQSEIYLADFGHVLMGITRALTLKASTEASYKNSGGTLVSAFDLDETVIRATASHDFDTKHDKAHVVLQGVKWGA